MPSTSRATRRGERQELVRDSAGYLSDNFDKAPMLLIPCIWGRLDNDRRPDGAGVWGSLLPAVWSFMLALRERGMGSAWTTIHLMNDGEREVAELLGIPYDKVSQGGLFPIAYTIGTDFKPAKRVPLANGPALGPVVTSTADRRDVPPEQDGFAYRFDWGPDGLAALAPAAAVVVIVDVLRFTSAVSAAVEAGARA